MYTLNITSVPDLYHGLCPPHVARSMPVRTMRWFLACSITAPLICARLVDHGCFSRARVETASYTLSPYANIDTRYFGGHRAYPQLRNLSPRPTAPSRWMAIDSPSHNQEGSVWCFYLCCSSRCLTPCVHSRTCVWFFVFFTAFSMNQTKIVCS